MLIGFFGYKGSGKTLAMVLFGYLFYLDSKKILANLKLTYKHEIVDVKDIVELSPNLINSVILLDEIHMIADSRVSGAFQNRAMSYFVLQSRHRSCHVLYTTQFGGQVDKRIRENTDIKVICENLHIGSDGDGFEDVFRIVVQDKRTYPYSISELTIYGKPIWDMYNTDYIINPFLYKKPKKDKKK